MACEGGGPDAPFKPSSFSPGVWVGVVIWNKRLAVRATGHTDRLQCRAEY